MATNNAVLVSLFCFVATSSAVAAQQPAGNPAGTKGGLARAGVNGVRRPVCIYCPPVLHSKEALADKYIGTIVLEVTVTTDGKVIDPVVTKSPGLGLDEKALEQVKKWKLKPALGQDGKPVDCRVEIEFTFHLY